ncbi:hypothetical protein RF11_14463 [Thelohanellus kitauei]|uniref:Uncharacterized protein n=1 Tax=Thelohanellus kitauei TaxID=669202 RepID=A0A0C2J1X1_THEKT|nr:hypothetical protein RF11_14463 [Thelohanellus kitauei]
MPAICSCIVTSRDPSTATYLASNLRAIPVQMTDDCTHMFNHATLVLVDPICPFPEINKQAPYKYLRLYEIQDPLKPVNLDADLNAHNAVTSINVFALSHKWIIAPLIKFFAIRGIQPEKETPRIDASVKAYIEKHDRAKETIAHCSLEYKPGEFFSVDKAVLTFREYVGQNHLDILIVSPELRTIWIVECQLLTFTSSTRLGASKTHSYVHWANTLKQAWLYRNIVVTDVFLPLSSNDRAIIDLAHVVHDPRVFAGHCHKANINFAIIILKCFGCGGVKRLSREGTRPE